MTTDQETEDILIALDQVEQTIDVMSAVVSRLKYQLMERIQDNFDCVEMGAISKEEQAGSTSLETRPSSTESMPQNEQGGTKDSLSTSDGHIDTDSFKQTQLNDEHSEEYLIEEFIALGGLLH